MMKWKRALPYMAAGLMAGQTMLMLVSWIYSAARPTSGVRSLLSGEGLRWFFGHFAEMVSSPALAWLLLLSIASGCLQQCGLLSLKVYSRQSYRERRAMLITLLLLLAYVGVIAMLALVPHSVLLSATGHLWPSPFSASLIPFVAFGIILLSSVYGIVAGRFDTLGDVYRSMISGIGMGAPVFLFYILVIQIYYSIRYTLPQNPYF